MLFHFAKFFDFLFSLVSFFQIVKRKNIKWSHCILCYCVFFLLLCCLLRARKTILPTEITRQAETMYSTNNNSNSQKLCAVEQTKEQVGTKGEKKFIFLSGVFFARDKLFEIDIEFVNRKILIVCVRIICDYGMRLNESKKSGEQTKKYAQNFHRTVSTDIRVFDCLVITVG